MFVELSRQHSSLRALSLNSLDQLRSETEGPLNSQVHSPQKAAGERRGLIGTVANGIDIITGKPL